MNYDEMPAGREMDALIAEKVMGWVVRFSNLSDAPAYFDEQDILQRLVDDWNPKINIFQAKKCLETILHRHGHGVTMSKHFANWDVTLIRKGQAWHGEDRELATAICKAIVEARKEEGK